VEQALNRLRSFAARPHQAPRLLPNRPKHTVRLRLTILYGGMFLVAGAALLAICYALVVRGTDASSGAAQVSALTTSGSANLAGSSGTTAAAEALGLTGPPRRTRSPSRWSLSPAPRPAMCSTSSSSSRPSRSP
jgi:hypothetical protein